MGNLLIGIFGTLFMLALVMFGVPIALSFILVGSAGLIYILGPSAALPQLEARLFEVLSMYSWTVVPLFVVMGEIAFQIGIIGDLYECFQKWFRRLKGALTIATIFACAAFGAVSGSSAGTAAAISKMAFPEMRKKNYSADFIAGVLASGGTLGFIIPPSIAMVVYGNCTDTSVGQLMIAGIIPGIILSVLFSLVVVIRVSLNPELAPLTLEPVTLKEKLMSLKGVLPPLGVFALMIAGLYIGFFTPTEAGAAGVFLLLLFGWLQRRITFSMIKTSFHEGLQVTCMIFLIVYGALLFGDFLAFSRFTPATVNAVANLEVSKYLIFAIFVVIILIMGCILEAISVIIIATPLMFPVIDKLGFDPIWFGIVFVLLTQAGTITPPVGVNVYVVSGILKGEVTMLSVFKESVWFVLAIAVMIAIITVFPSLVTFLPSLAAAARV